MFSQACAWFWNNSIKIWVKVSVKQIDPVNICFSKNLHFYMESEIAWHIIKSSFTENLSTDQTNMDKPTKHNLCQLLI